jgi:hypothetical protein
VEGVLVHNGITVKISKPAAGGIAALNSTQKFHFPWEEGLFDFKADEARLENGRLSFKFTASSPVAQKRVFKFPPHFNMDAPAAVTDWAYANDDDAQHAHTLQTHGKGPIARSTVSAPACLYPAGKNSGALLEQMSEVGKAASSASSSLLLKRSSLRSAPTVIGGHAKNESVSGEGDHCSSWLTDVSALVE